MRINFFGDFAAVIGDDPELSTGIQKKINQADLNVLNFEAAAIDISKSCYSRISKSGPAISQLPNKAQWVIRNGFHAVSLANNHIFDFGDKGIDETLENFDCIKTMGAGTWEQAYTPTIFYICGKKVAILALSHCEFGTLVDKWDSKLNRGAAWINHPDVDNIIKTTRENVDLLFVFAHAGVEHFNQPLPEWRDRYRSFIDLGCDAVISSHPHIIQGWEIYKEKPIVYSLGNFYFPKVIPMKSTWYKSIVATLDIDDYNGINMKITPLCFKNGYIEEDNSQNITDYLQEVNSVLNNKTKYINCINKESVNRMEMYYTMFQNGGMARCYTLKKIVRALIFYLRHRKSYNPAWLYNNIQSESHRWIFIRGLKLLNNLK